jgi:hypothetical protein
VLRVKISFFIFLIGFCAHGWLTAGRDENKGGGVHAVAFAGRCGAVIEDVSEVRAGLAVHDLRSFHTVAIVLDQADGVGVDGGIEAWPAGMGVEFGFRAKDGLEGGRGIICSFLVKVVVFTGEGSFGALFPENIVLIGGEAAFPFGVGVGHGIFCLCRCDRGIWIVLRLSCRGQCIDENGKGQGRIFHDFGSFCCLD